MGERPVVAVEDRGFGRRIWIFGAPGAGKTTVACDLHARLALPHCELDRLFWRQGWRMAGLQEFQAAVGREADLECWIIDGQYDMVHRTLAAAADTAIWIDPPWPVLFWRIVRRTLRQLARREVLWNGNRQGPLKAARLLLWTVRTYLATRRRNQAMLLRLSGQGVACERVRTAADYDRLLALAESQRQREKRRD